MNSIGTTGVVVIIIVTVLKIIDHMVTKRSNKELIDQMGLIINKLNCISEVVDKTYVMHDRYDQDGIPLWYMPRSWGSILVDLAATMKEISNTQKMIVKSLDKQS